MVREIKDIVRAIIAASGGQLHELCIEAMPKDAEYIASYEETFNIPTDQRYPAVYIEDNNVLPGGFTQYDGTITNTVILVLDIEPFQKLEQEQYTSADFEVRLQYLAKIRKEQERLNNIAKQIIDILLGGADPDMPYTLPPQIGAFTFGGQQNLDIDRFVNLHALYPIGYFMAYRKKLIGSGYSVNLKSPIRYCAPKTDIVIDPETFSLELLKVFGDSPSLNNEGKLIGFNNPLMTPSTLANKGFKGQTVLVRKNYPNISKPNFQTILAKAETWLKQEGAINQTPPSVNEESAITLLGLSTDDYRLKYTNDLIVVQQVNCD